MDSILYIYISWEMTPISIGGEKQASISGGSHLPADIVFGKTTEMRRRLREEANRSIAKMLQKETADTLDKVLFELSGQMKNAYSRSDA